MTDRVVEIQYNDLANLKRLYTPGGSKSYIAYMAIENYIRWLDQNPNESNYIKFFCLNGDFSDGTFVVTVSTYVVTWLNLFRIQFLCKNFLFFAMLFLLKGTNKCICGYVE